MKQLQLNELIKLTQAKHTDSADELAEQGYEDLLEHWCVDYEYTGEQCAGITGAVLVDTVMWMGDGTWNALRCYTHEDALVLQDSNGGLWVTQEQEEKYFL
jgi:hypothetical protein